MDSYKIFSQFYKERRDLLYDTADGVVACRKKDELKLLHKHNLIILPQLYQTEVLFRSHDQMGHQGIDKVQQRLLHRSDWRPGLRKACERSCLQVKDPRKIKLPSSPWKALNLLGRSDRPAEDLHDRLGIQSDTGN